MFVMGMFPEAQVTSVMLEERRQTHRIQTLFVNPEAVRAALQRVTKILPATGLQSAAITSPRSLTERGLRELNHCNFETQNYDRWSLLLLFFT